MFNKLSDRIYIQPPEHFTDRPNVGLVIGDKYTLMFEAGNSAANVELLKGRLWQTACHSLILWLFPTGTGTTALVCTPGLCLLLQGKKPTVNC